MDYLRIATALNQLGIDCDEAVVHRAEAARALERGGATEHEDTFRFYIETALGFLGAGDDRSLQDAVRRDSAAREHPGIVVPRAAWGAGALRALRQRGLRRQ